MPETQNEFPPPSKQMRVFQQLAHIRMLKFAGWQAKRHFQSTRTELLQWYLSAECSHPRVFLKHELQIGL